MLNNRLQEPSVLNWASLTLKNEQKEAKGQIVKHRAYKAECYHKLPDGFNIPAPGIIDHFIINPVVAMVISGKFRHQVGEQDLLGQQMEEME